MCTSINNEIVHGIPSERRVLKTGDIVSIDTGVVLDGYYGDAAITVPVDGEPESRVAEAARRDPRVAYRGIEAARVGNTVGDVGAAVQKLVEANGFSVVREFVGHGIGTKLHEDPQVPNYGAPGSGPKLRDGMVLAIEPMVNVGRSGNAVAGRQVDSRHARRKLERPLRTLRGSDEERASDFDGVVVGCQWSVVSANFEL